MSDEKAHEKATHHAPAHHAPATKAKAATKQILRNVVYHDRTYKPGDEDDLEERLTAEALERLTADDPPTLAGEWKPAGKGEEPAPNSRAAREARAAAGGPAVPGPGKTHPAVAEAERLREENKKLKAEVEKSKGGK